MQRRIKFTTEIRRHVRPHVPPDPWHGYMHHIVVDWQAILDSAAI